MLTGMLMLAWLTYTIISVATKAPDHQASIGLITACAGMLAAFGTITGQLAGQIGTLLSRTQNDPSSQSPLPVTVENSKSDPANTAIVQNDEFPLVPAEKPSEGKVEHEI
jgi:hypothetical protein